jgi:peroxiredoxin
LVLLRIDTKESRETVKKFLAKTPLNSPILLDENNKVGKLLGVWVHPTSYLIDAHGMLQYRVLGAADWMGVGAVSIIDKMVGEK